MENISNSFNDDILIQKIGKSFDSFFEIEKSHIVSGPIKRGVLDKNDMGNITYSLISSQNDLNRTRKTSISTSFRSGLGKVKSNISNEDFFKINSYNCYLFSTMRIFNGLYSLDFNNSSIVQSVRDFLKEEKNTADYKGNIRTLIGNKIITSVKLASELVIKFEIQTRDESQKKKFLSEVSASTLGAKGSFNFSSLKETLKKDKNVSIDILGNIPTGKRLLKKLDLDSIEEMIVSYPESIANVGSIHEYGFTDIRYFPDFFDVPPLYRYSDYRKLESVLYAIDYILENLEIWKNDLEYATDNKNADQFENDAITMAKEHLGLCNKALSKITLYYYEILDNWEETGTLLKLVDEKKLITDSIPKERNVIIQRKSEMKEVVTKTRSYVVGEFRNGVYYHER